MATYRWIGNALAVAQVTDWVLGGTWEATDEILVTINGKTITVVAGSTTIETIVDTLVTALNASAITEFTEITWSKQGTDTLRGTGDTAGVPFTCTISTTETGGGAADAQTIDGGTTDEPGTETVSATGPNDVGDGQNYENVSTGASGTLPVNGDTLILQNSTVSMLYHLNALAAVTLAVLEQYNTFTGYIGLPKTNAGGYDEYRPDYLAIGATLATLGKGQSGSGSGRIKINFGTVQTTTEVLSAGSSPESPLEAVLLKGTHASNSFTFKGQQTTAALAGFGGETSQAAVLHVNDALVRCGSGVTFPGGSTIENYKGRLSIESQISGTIYSAGNTLIRGSGTIAAMDVSNGTLDHQGTGTITDVQCGPGTFSRANDSRPLTVTDFTLRKGGRLQDPTQALTITNNLQTASDVSALAAT